MENFDQIPESLSSLLKQVSNNEAFKKFVRKLTEKMNFDKKNILNLSQEKVESLYAALKTKLSTTIYSNDMTKNFENSIWLQNQLRIFIYVVCAYLFLKKISIHELKHEDYLFIKEYFPHKKPEHLEYQIKLLLKNNNIKWSLQQSRLFREIMNESNLTNRWNYIAKQLYLRSNRKYFKTPKQCRQRWINHQDPSKIKGNWERDQDIVLLTSVLNYGKKWTLISRELKQRRTENSVKNRFNSLIKIAKKDFGYEKTEQNLIEKILEARNLQQQKQQIVIATNNNEKIDQKINQNDFRDQKINRNSQFENTSKKNQFVALETRPAVEKQETAWKQASYPVFHSNKSDFKYVFEQSEELQNVLWHSSQSHPQFEEQFYFVDGKICFEDENPI